jgi:hypothetical protein
VSSVMVVQVQPAVEGGGAFVVGVVGPHIGPFGQQGAVEPLDFAVRLGGLPPGRWTPGLCGHGRW